MTQREECGGTYIGVSECTRREEYDGIGGGSKWGVSIYGSVGSPSSGYYYVSSKVDLAITQSIIFRRDGMC